MEIEAKNLGKLRDPVFGAPRSRSWLAIFMNAKLQLLCIFIAMLASGKVAIGQSSLRDIVDACMDGKHGVKTEWNNAKSEIVHKAIADVLQDGACKKSDFKALFSSITEQSEARYAYCIGSFFVVFWEPKSRIEISKQLRNNLVVARQAILEQLSDDESFRTCFHRAYVFSHYCDYGGPAGSLMIPDYTLIRDSITKRLTRRVSKVEFASESVASSLEFWNLSRDVALVFVATGRTDLLNDMKRLLDRPVHLKHVFNRWVEWQSGTDVCLFVYVSASAGWRYNLICFFARKYFDLRNTLLWNTGEFFKAATYRRCYFRAGKGVTSPRPDWDGPVPNNETLTADVWLLDR